MAVLGFTLPPDSGEKLSLGKHCSNFGFFLQIGQLLATTEWKNQAVRQHVQDAFVYGSHNSLCLAHGRKPIQEVKTTKFFTISFMNLTRVAAPMSR